MSCAWGERPPARRPSWNVDGTIVTDWSDFTAELDRWAAAGLPATFWWRDDDAVDVSPALERLLDLSRDRAAPLALAVIPATARPALAVRLAPEVAATVMQHGFAHRNHA